MIKYVITIAFAFLYSTSPVAFANAIHTDQLKEFEQLYVENNKCQRGCSGVEKLRLLNYDDSLSILTFEMRAESLQNSWIELPFNSSDVTLLNSTVDGDVGFATRVDHSVGWLIKKGSSTVVFSIQLKNPQGDVYLRKHVPLVQSDVPLWELQEKDSRQYFKKKEHQTSERVSATSMNIQLQPLYILERQLTLDKKWNVRSTLRPIVQQAKSDTLVFNVPLLEGERLLSSDAKHNNQTLQIEIKNNESFSWTSEMEPRTSIAVPSVDNTVQHVIVTTQQSWLIKNFSVAPYDRPQIPNAKNSLAFWVAKKPLTITTELLRFEPGAAHQISRSNLHVKNTTGLVEYSLQLELVSSLGGKYTIEKPSDLTFEKAMINQQEQTITVNNNTLLIDVLPGVNSIHLSFKQSPSRFLWREPVFRFQSIPMNHTVKWDNNGQWLWWLGGADLRPSVLLWPILFLIGVGVWLAHKYQWTKTTPLQNALLMFGAVQGGWFFISIALLWMCTLRYKDALPQDISRRSYNALQLANITIMILFFTGLLTIVAHGLLQWPTSLVSGFNSSDRSWTTYTQLLDSSSGAWALYLPQAWYRIAMLAWATWLAFNIIQWAKWSMEQVVRHDFWKKKPAVLQNTSN